MNPGFDTRNVFKMSFDLGLQGYAQEKGQQFHRQVIERVQALPGVKSAAVASNIPLDLNYNSNNIYVEGQPLERGTNLPTAMVASASPNYFATMGTSVLQGREFTDRDTQNSELVGVVNETFVRRLIPDAGSSAGAIGRHAAAYRGDDQGGSSAWFRMVSISISQKSHVHSSGLH